LLKLAENLTPEKFLHQHWQKQPLFMPQALERIRPSISRNELGWLATLEDVESRLVFVERDGQRTRYRVESGPFEPEYLQELPKRDWTLLVHDVEKHLPAMRALFRHIPFVPDWRIDDLMVSFAAPGGGVGPHRDNYDVFLCQGIGQRNWQFTTKTIADDAGASDDLALLQEFEGDEQYDAVEGDVLYLPPGAGHWGSAKRACITYSIGMRAPQANDLNFLMNSDSADDDEFYRDPDLMLDEVKPGFISKAAAQRAVSLLGLTGSCETEVAAAIGQFATQTKDWLTPDAATADETESAINYFQSGGRLNVHGMALIAFDDRYLHINGTHREHTQGELGLIEELCVQRRLVGSVGKKDLHIDLLTWLLQQGAIEIPENS
jgi:50S ribosomal protein L16 3-hydroxylase